jgi:twitching motility protein PilT
MRLRDAVFKDLYLEEDVLNSRFRGLNNSMLLLPPPEELVEELRMFYRIVDERFRSNEKENDFSIPYDGPMYRVAVIRDVRHRVYALRRSAIITPDFTQIGLLPVVREFLLALKMGFVIFVGSYSSGKTTAVSAFCIEWVCRNAGLGVSLEDPPELSLSGDHGRGRLLQIPVSRETVEREFVNTMRMTFDLLFISEIRTGTMAFDTIDASGNGRLVTSTLHADSIVGAISRIVSMASEKAGGNAGGSQSTEKMVRQMLGANLKAIVFMEQVSDHQWAATQYLLHTDSVRAKIQNGEFASIANDVQQQMHFLGDRNLLPPGVPNTPKGAAS